MKIHELITMLQAYDPEAEIRIYGSCGCCGYYEKDFSVKLFENVEEKFLTFE